MSILVFSLVLLALVRIPNTYAARRNEITIVFCGSKKRLANGIPIVNVLFSSAIVMVCAVLAQRYARKQAALVAATPEVGNPRGGNCAPFTQPAGRACSLRSTVDQCRQAG